MTQTKVSNTLETPAPDAWARVLALRRVIHPLVWVGAASLALYACLAWLYPLAAGLPTPLRTWAGLVRSDPLIGLAHGGIYIALMALYVIGLRSISTLAQPIKRRVWVGVIGVWLAASVAGAFSFPGESLDIFDYTFRGRMFGLYDRSPLNTTPFELKDKPFLGYVSWDKWVDAYGPIWEYASGNVARLVQLVAAPAELRLQSNVPCTEQPAVCTLLAKHVWAYRIFAINCAGLCGALIYAMVRRNVPAQANTALLAWLWNPLLIVASAMGGHNETLVLLPVLMALWLMQRQHWLGGLLCLVAAAHIKLTCLIFLPPALLWLWMRLGWRATLLRVSVLVALAVPLSWLLYEPLGGWETLPKNLFERSLLSANSISNIIYWSLREFGGWPRYTAQQAVARAASILFALSAGVWLWRWWRKRDASDRSLWRAFAVIAALYFFVGSYWFQHWYLLWLVALAALLPTTAWAMRLLPVYALSALLATHLLDFLNNHKPAPVFAPLPASVLYVVVLLLPLWVAALVQTRADKRLQELVTLDEVA